MAMTTCFVQLGRIGDVLNSLPLAWEHSRRGPKPFFMIGSEFAPVLDGCSYVEPFPWSGDWTDLAGALDYAKKNFDEVYCTQVYSKNYFHNPRTDSFCKDSWAQIGRTDWSSLPLVFDLRDKAREQRMLNAWQWTPDKPVILVATSGNSSPFKHAHDLEERIWDEFEKTHDIIPLDFKAERFFDLLGLYDVASCLVTIDSAPMHLAHSSRVPVVALVSDEISPWHGTPRYPGQVFRMGYSEYPKKPNAILEAMHAAMAPRPDRKLIHVWSNWSRDADATRRHALAWGTWQREYKAGPWTILPIQEGDVATSSVLNDPRPVPRVNEMVSIAIEEAHPDDLIVLCNDDICWAPGLTDTLLNFRHQCGWSHRRDFKSLHEFPSTIGLAAGHKYPGTDLFVFTPDWWKQAKLPPMYLARNQFDLVFKAQMQIDGGIEIPIACGHEQHPSFWSTGNAENTNPANLFNRNQASIFAASRGIELHL